MRGSDVVVSAGIEFWTSAGIVTVSVIVIVVGVGVDVRLWSVVDEVDVDSLAVIFCADWRDRGDGIFGFVPKFASHA